MTRTMMARATPKAGQDAQLRTLVEDLARSVRAEPGNIRFEVFAEDGGAMVMLEEYRDEAAFEAHLEMPHTKQFNAALGEVAAGGGSQVTDLTDLAAERHAAPPSAPWPPAVQRSGRPSPRRLFRRVCFDDIRSTSLELVKYETGPLRRCCHTLGVISTRDVPSSEDLALDLSDSAFRSSSFFFFSCSS